MDPSEKMQRRLASNPLAGDDPADDSPDTIAFVPTEDGKARARNHRSRLEREQMSVWDTVKANLDVVVVVSFGILCLVALQVLLSIEAENPEKQIFHKDQLERYVGHRDGPIYLAVMGDVFEVSGGAQHYGPGQGYAFFSGKDASRAFITGDFENDLHDEVEDFTPEQCAGLLNWRDFYHSEYIFKGRLKGAFYDFRGQPTALQRIVTARAAEAVDEEEEARERAAAHPNCNKRWTAEAGGEVWCAETAYPRLVFEDMKDGKPRRRCACYDEIGYSDVRQVYPGCSPEAHRCSTAGLEAQQRHLHDAHKTHHEQEL